MSQFLSPEQERILREKIAENELLDAEKTLLEVARNAILLEKAPASDESAPIFSRLGGLPMVPPDWIWPDALFFYAQIDLASVAPFDSAGLLPKSGVLLFFGAEDYDYSDNGETLSPNCRVFYFPKAENLVEAPAPAGFLPVQLSSGEAAIYRPLPVIARSHISFPTSYASSWQPLEAVDEGRLGSLIGALHDRSYHFWRSHQMLGHHAFCDGDFTDVLNLSDEDRALGEWLLLLQLDSDDNLGTMFNDAGVYFFGIAAVDLAAARFDRVRCGFWSS